MQEPFDSVGVTRHILKSNGVEVGAADSSLVPGTQLGRAHVKVFPTCREATIVFGSPGSATHVAKGEGGDPDASRERARRRRKQRIRRYCMHNRLMRLWTLTYATEVWDYDTVKADLNKFFRDLRKHRGKKFAYLWVIERHPKGHGLHVHIAMRGFIHKATLQETWGHGIVHFSDSWKKRAQRQKGLKNGAGMAAYLAKELSGYIAKEETHISEKHFYDCGQGFQPTEEVEQVQGLLASIIGHVAAKHFGGESPWREWDSSEADDWTGPPVHCAWWW